MRGLFRRPWRRDRRTAQAANHTDGPVAESAPVPEDGPGDAEDEARFLDLRLDRPEPGAIHLTPEHTDSLRAGVAELAARLGPGHSDTLDARHHLAFLYLVWVQASSHGPTRTRICDHVIALLTENLGHQLRSLGPSDRDTLITLAMIGAAYLDSGRPGEAVRHLGRVVAEAERTGGLDEATALDYRNRLAEAYGELGHSERSIEEREKVLAGSRRVLRRGDPVLEQRKEDLFYAYHRAGLRDQALTLGREILADQEEFRGPDHLRTFVWIDNLAHLHHDGGEWEEAIACYERAVYGFESIEGPHSPDLAPRVHNLAMAHLESGHPDRAVPYLRRALEIHEHAHGANKLSTLDALLRLATCLDRAGRFDEAAATTERLLARLERLAGPDHPKTTEIRTYLTRLRGSAD